MEIYWGLWSFFLAVGISTFPILLITPAPYGKFTRKGWGPILPGRVCWMIQESPSLLITLYYFWIQESMSRETKILLAVVTVNYVYRSLIYGYLMSEQSQTTFSVFFSALFFNSVNGYLQAAGLTHYDVTPSNARFRRFWIGILIWFSSWVLTVQSDTILLSLKNISKNTYKIPYGGLFTFLSCPNYVTECTAWLGWAIACENHGGWLFFVMSVSNLFPRAISTHQWYFKNFKDYKNLKRKIFLPFIL